MTAMATAHAKAAARSPKLPHIRSASALPGSSLGISAKRLPELLHVIREGLPYHALEELSASSALSIGELSSLLAIPERTLARRKSAGRLSSDESERLLRLARIFEKAVELFEGSSNLATQWLRLPKKALAGETPLTYATTELGAREVENLLGRLAHGVFS